MGSDNLHSRRTRERIKRREEVMNQRSSSWLVICEGEQTEPNYFMGAVNAINEKLEDPYKLKVKVIGKGMNTLSLVKSAENIQNDIDRYCNTAIPYGKVFVVFDKDSFDSDDFDNAIMMCNRNGYIPLWSNQAIEYWFLLHFNYLDVGMDRKVYTSKINEYFKLAGFDYRYKKNDKDIYQNLCNYGSLDKAIKNARNIHLKHQNDAPSKSESCTAVYLFFDEVSERLNELK